MKKRLLIFLGIFILMIIPKNVFAESIQPLEFYVDNTILYNWQGPTGNTFTFYTPIESGNYANITVKAYSTDTTIFKKYPFVVVYFKSSIESIAVTRVSSCNDSCFSEDIQVAKIGHTTFEWGNGYLYALVLPVSKQYIDNSSSTVRVEDILRVSSWDSVTRPFVVYSAYYSDTNPLENNTYGQLQDILDSQNQNANNIINNQNNNTQSVINNNTQNTQTIINNQNDNAQQAHQDSQDIKNAITSDDIPDNNSNQANEWASNNASDSVVSDMVLMPITLLNAFSTGFNGTCQPYNLGSLYGTDLTLPCVNLSNYLGSTLWTIIDVLMSGFLIYGIGKKFVKVFNDFTNLKDSQVDELYGGGSE